MRILFAGVPLAVPDEYPAMDLALNGQLVFEPVPVFRAARQRLFLRGNELVTVTFRSSRQFASLREAQRHQFGWWGALPKSGLAEIVVGAGLDVETISMPGAVLSAMPTSTSLGLRVTTEYQITAPGVDLVEPIITPGGGRTMVIADRQAIPADATSVTVMFTEALPGTPIVTATVEMPTSGGASIWATVRRDSVSTTGFVAELSGPTPDADYTLAWTAIA